MVSTLALERSSDRLGHDERRRNPRLDERAEPFECPSLVAKVELLADLELAARRAAGAWRRRAARRSTRLSSVEQRLHERQVDRDAAVDPRAEHLDRDVAAVVEACAVHDGDRGPADRVTGRTTRTRRRARMPSSSSTSAATSSGGPRARCRGTERNSSERSRAEESGARRDELAELDEGAAERPRRRGGAGGRTPPPSPECVGAARRRHDRARGGARARRRSARRAGRARRGWAPGGAARGSGGRRVGRRAHDCDPRGTRRCAERPARVERRVQRDERAAVGVGEQRLGGLGVRGDGPGRSRSPLVRLDADRGLVGLDAGRRR